MRITFKFDQITSISFMGFGTNLERGMTVEVVGSRWGWEVAAVVVVVAVTGGGMTVEVDAAGCCRVLFFNHFTHLVP
ncbi:hypothetical protein Hanom_Chr07g00662421 [Helianthus anomalus]